MLNGLICVQESSQHRLSETKVYIQSEGITKEYLRDLSQNFANVTDILAFPDKSFGALVMATLYCSLDMG